ncbi:MAG: M1 family aminopeptidase [Acidobacteriota bacterium]|jgi:aminopeptidase N|nr:M1 family aminopeptidase [Acidobacteriota bacterium]
MFWKILIVNLFLFSMTTFAQTMPPLEKGVSQTLAKWRAANYSDVRYKLNLTIEKKAPTLKGSIEVNVKLKTENGKLNPIILDWRKIKGHKQLSKISNVSVNGKTAKFEESNEHLIFKENIKTGENIIKLDFESPILTSGGAITRYIDKEDGAEYIYSLFVPSDASTAFPVFDQPDLKARFQLNLAYPKNWQAVSNAKKSGYVNGCGASAVEFNVDTGKVIRSINSECLERLSFEETKPISTYVFAFAAGEFVEFEDKQSAMPSKLYVRKSQAAKLKNANERSADTHVRTIAKQSKKSSDEGNQVLAQSTNADRSVRTPVEEVFRLNRESIKYLEDYFDYKFPFPKYDLVLIPEFPFGGMEHAGATFLRESSVIFPTEPTANNYISRANLIFHENAHQWFGDTVTMKWFDDLWLKEGFATFMAYKAMEKVLPEYNAWKVFYERTKPLAYQTDVTRGTTPIYQEIPNLNSAKSAYGNIVYQKAPGFLRQAEFYLGEKEFQTAVRAFLKKHEFANAEWSDLVDEFENSSGKKLKEWAAIWVKQRGVPIIRVEYNDADILTQGLIGFTKDDKPLIITLKQSNLLNEDETWKLKTKLFIKVEGEDKPRIYNQDIPINSEGGQNFILTPVGKNSNVFIFPNYQDYGYGIFLLDEKSKKYILENIQNEKDDFLRSMMWGSLWDSVRFAELAPVDYVSLAIKNIGVEEDVSTISSILGRVDMAFTYYLSDAQKAEIAPKLEKLLIDKMQTAKTEGERITFYRAFLGIASSDNAKGILKDILNNKFQISNFKLRTKDKFDIVTKLIILGDKDAPKLLAELEKTETDDAAKRYAYAAKAGFATAENKAKFYNDFVNNKEIAENWIDEAVGVWNAPEHSELTLPYLEKALAELPNLKQNRKIFFVNGWLASFIGGQKSVAALEIVNKFLKDNPNLDIDLQRKILERLDGLERAVKIREKYGK